MVCERKGGRGEAIAGETGSGCGYVAVREGWMEERGRVVDWGGGGRGEGGLIGGLGGWVVRGRIRGDEW